MWPILLLAQALTLGTDPGLAPHGTPSVPSSSSSATNSASLSEPPAAEVAVGDVAPDFSYQSVDGHWRRLSDLRAQGPVLLVIGPDRPQLQTLQRQRERLVSLGIVPVVVADARSREARTLVRDLGLGYSLLADPRHVIAGQFNAVDSHTQGAVASWFVIDRAGRVRALGRGTFPAGDYTPIACEALGIPVPNEPLPVSH